MCKIAITLAFYLTVTSLITFVIGQNQNSNCICTLEYNPVCGTNGVTYSNRCKFNCDQTQTPGTTIAHLGTCEDDRPPQKTPSDECSCTLEYLPLCGSNGKTYGNRCQFNCDRARFSSLKVARSGPCQEHEQQNKQTSKCICTLEYKPVCGSDGTTYENRCQFNCAQNRHPSLTVFRNGPCEQHGPLQNQNNGCICAALYDPVCGSNGKTYGNQCELNCDKNRMPGLSTAQQGPCQNKQPQPPKNQNQNGGCACTYDYSPVCGSNGMTYSNRCELDCDRKRNPDIRVSRVGECEGKGGFRFPNDVSKSS